MTDAPLVCAAHSHSSPDEAADIGGGVGRPNPLMLSELTPAMLSEIWWSGYRAKRGEGMGVERVVQTELEMAGWTAVLEAMISASDLEWARRYLAMRECEAVGLVGR